VRPDEAGRGLAAAAGADSIDCFPVQTSISCAAQISGDKERADGRRHWPVRVSRRVYCWRPKVAPLAAGRPALNYRLALSYYAITSCSKQARPPATDCARLSAVIRLRL
jgi:hypothetical protein